MRFGAISDSARAARATPAGPIRLFDEDPELRTALLGLRGAAARTASELFARSWRLSRGPWAPAGNPPLQESDCGYLILDGLLLCRVRVGPRCSAELLGAGDLFRTDDCDTHGYATVASDASFRVLSPMRIVALERDLMARVESLPGIASHFERRLTERVRSLNVRLAIVQVPQLARRLHLVLWHLADRWGRRCSDGALIPFRVSHQVLAEYCSAQRTSVLVAIRELEKSGAVERNKEGLWLLRAQPPTEFT
jgi:CRP/FNR family transcriptional regulator, cyclic AMP receptor protein